jgi:hypothetical protein
MRLLGAICLLAAFVLAGCASSPEGLKPGASADDIRAQMGTPVATYALPGGGQRLEFRGNGPRTYMLDVDASGRLLRWVQVLNETNFRNIEAGMSKDEVRMLLGQPSDVSIVGREGNEIWSYHFQNIECQWFRVPFGSDGRTSAGGSRSMIQACMNATGGR